MSPAVFRPWLAPVAYLAFVPCAWAEIYTPITLPSGALNADIRTWSAGTDYNSLFPSSTQTTSGGVPFEFASNADGLNVIYNVADIDLAVGIYQVTTVYTLINTTFGSPGANVGQLTFTTSQGDAFSVDLVEGGNVRDHYLGSYVNTLSDPTVTPAVFGVEGAGRAHLDMQAFRMPLTWSGKTLSTVTFKSNQLGGTVWQPSQDGQPFLAAMTVASVPEPDGIVLALAGLVVAGGLTRWARAVPRERGLRHQLVAA